MSLLIILHEGGHFAAARLFKVRVEKFYLFFDFLFPFSEVMKFSLFKFKKGDTEYGLGWFPMGGYVKIAGMMDESNDKEAMAKPPQPWEYRSQKPWKRLIIIMGGIIVNLIVGILVLWGVKYTWGDTYVLTKDAPVRIIDSALYEAGIREGDEIVSHESFDELNRTILLDDVKQIQVKRGTEIHNIQLPDDVQKRIIKNKILGVVPRIPFMVEGFTEDSPNKESDLRKGDLITRLDTVPIHYFDEFTAAIDRYAGQKVTLGVERDGAPVNVTVQVRPDSTIGVAPLRDIKALGKKGLLKTKTVRYGFFESLPVALKAASRTLGDYVRQFKLIFDYKTEAYKEVGGFASMAKLFPDEWDWESFWRITAFLSLVLAFMNFLPIPMLDGGYVVFILYEMIRGKEPGEKFMNVANTVGFIIVIGLLVFANGNDLYKWIVRMFG